MADRAADNYAVIDSPAGRLFIRTDDQYLNGIEFVDGRRPLSKPASPLSIEVVRQLQAYFRDPGFQFQLPIRLDGSEHQQRVWAVLQTIKPGLTMTYGQVASRIGSGARAVGNSCRSNPVPIVVPCHRVVAAAGVGGYGGHTGGKVLARKEWLLKHEGSYPAVA